MNVYRRATNPSLGQEFNTEYKIWLSWWLCPHLYTAFSCWYFLEDVSYLWEEGGGFTKNILSYLENVIFDLGREGLKANFGNVMIYAGIFHGNRP